MSEGTQQGIILAITVIAVVASIVGGIVVGLNHNEKTGQQCIAAGKVWASGSCVDKASDVRFLDR
jgi:uncharacterized membrane protein